MRNDAQNKLNQINWYPEENCKMMGIIKDAFSLDQQEIIRLSSRTVCVEPTVMMNPVAHFAIFKPLTLSVKPMVKQKYSCLPLGLKQGAVRTDETI